MLLHLRLLLRLDGTPERRICALQAILQPQHALALTVLLPLLLLLLCRLTHVDGGLALQAIPAKTAQ
jgi:hypothetical protein